MSTTIPDVPEGPLSARDPRWESATRGLLSIVCTVPIASLVTVSHLDLPLHIALIAFAVAIPCLLAGAYWDLIKPKPQADDPAARRAAVEYLDLFSRLTALVGFPATAVGFIAFFWHLWPVAALVLILGAFVAQVAVLSMTLAAGWRDPRRMRKQNRTRPRQRPAQ
jgi:hypothetical protein